MKSNSTKIVIKQELNSMRLPVINRALLPAKAAYFFFYFSYSSVTPYITVFMTAYGLNAEQAGFVLGARLFAQFFSGPLWGGLADKTRKYRFMLLFQIVLSSILTFTAPWMPLALPTEVVKCQGTDFLGRNSSIMTTGMTYTFTTTTNPPAVISTLNPGNTSIPRTEDRNAEGLSTTLFPTTIKATSVEPQKNKSGDGSETSLQPSTSGGTSLVSTEASNSTKIKSTGKCTTKSKDKLFVLMIVWFALIGAFDGGIPLLIDNSVMDTIEKLGTSDFGKQRLWGAVGFGLAAFASGVGIELSGSKGPNYFTMFYIFLGSNICLFICCCFLDMSGQASKNDLLKKERSKKPNLLKGLIKTFKKFNVTFFFFTVLIMGIANGLLYGFMFLYIQDLKGSKIIMGLSILVACSTEVMMFPVSNTVIKFLRGNLIAVTLAFATYVIRFAGFSLLQNAWYILLLQLLHSICFALFWNATVYHTSDLAPPGMQATLLGIMNGVFFGFAGGFSSVVGGIVYNKFGGRNVFRGYAIVCAVWTVFLILHVLERKKRGKLGSRKQRAENKAQEVDMEEAPTSEKLLSESKA